ncbi:MAG TPA: D-alanyl-D-alanine carboxypeptidase family protein [Burkholderiaceae bacterium]|jgi:D-alanyl-D-alanine carboxypeptidase (penicillin-binding protein 5/6)|nr:D-alanyl-D-alanine carboxypeptidase family protein [Burkholderiaceae bacterium]
MLAARSWILVDGTSGARLAAFEPAARLEPASLTKLMTAYVVFSALSENRIALTDSVTVSPAAFATPGKLGARMYLEPGRSVSVDQLLRGMLTISANDAAVALAEHSAGTVDAFVDRMNAEVRRLGMANTHFANPTGLSDAQNYSSAEDMAILARRLLADFPQHAALFAQREFAYNNVSQANRNRLLWTDSNVDGMKTGQLSAAGWSIVATTARAQGEGERSFQRRLVAVVLGAPSDAARTQETLRLINHGYAAFDTVQLYRSGEVLATPAIWKGDRGLVPVGVDRDVYVTVASSELRALGRDALKSSIERPDPLVAPLQRGEAVGRMMISAGGRQVAEVPVVALERVETGGLLRRAYDAVVLWWRKRSV